MNACDRCRMAHRARPCFGKKRQIRLFIPEAIATQLKKQVPEGQRSLLIARLLDEHLNPNDHKD